MNTAGSEPTARPGLSAASRIALPTNRGHRATHAWPWGLISALALTAAIEWTVAHAGPKFLDPVAACWALTAGEAKTRTPGCDVLFAGDSLVKHSLIPRFVDEVTGRRSYNLAASASSTPATDALLRSAFDAGRGRAPSWLTSSPASSSAGRTTISPIGRMSSVGTDLWRLLLETKNQPFTTELLLGEVSPDVSIAV